MQKHYKMNRGFSYLVDQEWLLIKVHTGDVGGYSSTLDKVDPYVKFIFSESKCSGQGSPNPGSFGITQSRSGAKQPEFDFGCLFPDRVLTLQLQLWDEDTTSSDDWKDVAVTPVTCGEEPDICSGERTQLKFENPDDGEHATIDVSITKLSAPLATVEGDLRQPEGNKEMFESDEERFKLAECPSFQSLSSVWAPMLSLWGGLDAQWNWVLITILEAKGFEALNTATDTLYPFVKFAVRQDSDVAMDNPEIKTKRDCVTGYGCDIGASTQGVPKAADGWVHDSYHSILDFGCIFPLRDEAQLFLQLWDWNTASNDAETAILKLEIKNLVDGEHEKTLPKKKDEPDDEDEDSPIKVKFFIQRVQFPKEATISSLI
jgi:hypothetical protein